MQDSEKSNITPGTRLYSYDYSYNPPKLVEARVKRYKQKKDLYVIDVLTKDIHYKNLKYGDNTVSREVVDSFVKLVPDGVIVFAIVKDSEQIRDVMACIHSMDKSTGMMSSIPFAVCRQDCVDIYSMAEKQTPVKGQVWAGCSVSQRTCPAESNIVAFMNCQDILYTTPVAVYKDDYVDDFLACLNTDRFDNTLATYKKKHFGDNLVGIDSTLHDLLVNKNFMFDFHECFDVIEVPFLVREDVKHLIVDVISQVKKEVVTDVYIMGFDRSIPLYNFERPYVFMTPDPTKAKAEDRKLFVIGYNVDETQDYNKSKYGVNNIEEAAEKLGFTIL